MRTQAKVRELMTPRNTDVRSSFEVGDIVYLQKRRASQVAHMDSVRLCMADAARLRGQYAAHKAVICRVYPLRAS